MSVQTDRTEPALLSRSNEVLVVMAPDAPPEVVSEFPDGCHEDPADDL